MAEETIKDKILEAFEKLEAEKKDAMQKLGVRCICGKCEIPIYFSKEEVKKIIKNA